jgi:hypothetical protein
MDAFLTAYDPSDLPGGSIDPLGFERGYLLLADKILPGMTNVANCPRYFGLLCVGAYLAGADPGNSPREMHRTRQEGILRLERLWVLANYLARERHGGNLSGLRGVTYAERYVTQLTGQRGGSTDGDYRLLVRQVPYGVLGIYGAVAEGCKLIDRSTYTVTPGLGEPLAEAFLVGTATPVSVKKAVARKGEVSLSVLAEWGSRAYLWGKPGKDESRCIREMLHGNAVRSRFASWLERLPTRNGENELGRLERLAARLQSNVADRDLWEAVAAILRYERCYRIVALALERLLFLCGERADTAGSVRVSDLGRDSILRNVREELPAAVTEFTQHFDSLKSDHLLDVAAAITDVRDFLVQAARAACTCGSFLETILLRHTDVQHGKFDRGRRKLPWLQVSGDRLALTMTRIGGKPGEVTAPEEIESHPYRLGAADNWLKAARES